MRLLNSYQDDELITLLTQGDEAAFSQIYRTLLTKLYNESHKRLKDEALCADVIQDIFADLWLNRDNKKIENLAAYLCTAVRFRCLYFV